jgi:hypothetical protein
MKNRIALLSLLAAVLPTWAHDGHAAATPFHWHATDTFGLMATVSLAALAIWLSRK